MLQQRALPAQSKTHPQELTTISNNRGVSVHYGVLHNGWLLLKLKIYNIFNTDENWNHEL